MKSYYRVSPRGFANEDVIFSAATATEKAKANAILSNLRNDPSAWGEKITRKEAERITAGNRRAERKGEANPCNPAGATKIISISEY